MTCVEKHSAGDMAISLPDTLAKVLTLTAVEFFNTSIINTKHNICYAHVLVKHRSYQ
jgi:hypothetical protein